MQNFRCPQCGLQLEPAVAINGSPSEFWLTCPKCNVYVNTYIPQAHQYAFHEDAHTYCGNFGG